MNEVGHRPHRLVKELSSLGSSLVNAALASHPLRPCVIGEWANCIDLGWRCSSSVV